MHASLLTNVNCTTFFHIFYLQFDSINRIFVVMHKAYYGDANGDGNCNNLACYS